MENQTWTYILAALSGGCGLLQQIVLTQILKWREEEGKPVSPKSKRRISLAIAPSLPTLLYLLAVWAGWTTYELANHLLYVGLAFMSAQGLHGETRLPSGADIRKAEVAALTEPPTRTGGVVGVVQPMGHTPYIAPIAPIDSRTYHDGERIDVAAAPNVFHADDMYEGDPGDEVGR